MCKGKLVLVGGRLFMLLVVAYIGRHMWGEKSKVHVEVCGPTGIMIMVFAGCRS